MTLEHIQRRTGVPKVIVMQMMVSAAERQMMPERGMELDGTDVGF